MESFHAIDHMNLDQVRLALAQAKHELRSI
jgi:hypothetical protein